MAADNPIIATDSPILDADGLIIASDGLIDGADCPIIAPDDPINAIDCPIIAPDSSIFTTDRQERAAALTPAGATSAQYLRANSLSLGCASPPAGYNPAMNTRLQNHLNMIGACLTVAHSDPYPSVWTGQPPADFEADLATLATDYHAIVAKAALAETAVGGAADAKAEAETALEDAAFLLAQGLANHFRKEGDLDRLGKVHVAKRDLTALRAQALVNQAAAIRDLGAATANEPKAAGRGVTAGRVASVAAALNEFSRVMSTPRGQIVNRSTLLREVESDVAALRVQVSALDELVGQFEGSEAGTRFVRAWKRARMIVDSGGGHTSPAPPTPAPTPPQ